MKNITDIKKEIELYLEEKEHGFDEYFSFVDNDYHFYDDTLDCWEGKDCIIFPNGKIIWDF